MEFRRVLFRSRNWKGELSTAWEGGRHLDKDGYVIIYMPSHPHARSGKYVGEHRLVMEGILGRYLTLDEVVHHKDKNHQNNSPENLELFSQNSEHLKRELTGHIPNWSESGLENILAGLHSQKGKHYPRMSAAAKARPPRARLRGRFVKLINDVPE